MSGVSVSSPTPNRVRTPRWFDLRLVLGIVLVLGSVLVGAKIVSGAHATYRMPALTHDVAAGATLRADDLHLVQVRLPGHGSGVYVARTGDAVGHRLNRALAEGELVPTAALSEAPALTTVSVPIAAGRAPTLRAGERVQLWLSTKLCPSLVLLADVTVQDARASAGTIGSASGQDIVLSVPADLADRVIAALALPDAAIRAGILTGARHDGANDALPSLSGCAAQPS